MDERYENVIDYKRIFDLRPPCCTECSGREEICGDVIVLPAAPATESPTEAPTEPPMLLPDECSADVYTVLDDVDRVVAGGKDNNCDNTDPTQYNNAAVQSPDWIGTGWYRMVMPGGRPGGSKIPEEQPDVHHCGTYVGGYISTPHPEIVGDTDEVTFCFGLRKAGKECKWSTDGKVTHCGDYYVYYLPDTPHCRLRYCAEN